MSGALLRQLRAMDRAELGFRATMAVRSTVDRARTAVAPPRWRRDSLRLAEMPQLDRARELLRQRNWIGAHRELARHFATREPRFPLDPRRIDHVAREVRNRFPGGDADAVAERVLGGQYDLLGYRGVKAGSPPDWHLDAVHGLRAPVRFWKSVPYLERACGDHKVTWEINRHQYFLQLGRAYALTRDDRFYQAFVQHLSDWMTANPPLMGTNWASMLEAAFRCLSWLWALHFFAPAASEGDSDPWTVDLLLGLDRQLAHVEQNLSRYFSPNTHLTGEALALYVAARALPELGRAGREATGRDVLLQEAERQVFPDGGHAERSAHYHRYSTDFYLLAFNVARLTGDAFADPLREAAQRQARYLRAITDDAGRLPLLGDDDGGQLFPICGPDPADATDTLAIAAVLLDEAPLAVGPSPEATWWACGTTSRMPEFSPRPAPGRSAAFQDTGYYVCRDADGNHLVFDAGRHGFLNGGHAHADALSVVCTASGRPLLVDSGTGTYTMDAAARDRFRSTAMHNTIVVNRRSQSEPRGPFHWLSRTDAECIVWQPGTRADVAEGCHEGYAPIVHTRTVVALHGIGWILVDHFTGATDTASLEAMWHVHPQWRIATLGGQRATFATADGGRASLAASVGLARVTTRGLDAFAPEYGRIQPGLCLVGAIETPLPFSAAAYLASGDGWEARAVTAVRVNRPAGEPWHTTAFEVETAAGRFRVLSAVPRNLAAARHDPPPLAPWGSEAHITDARLSVVLVTPSGTEELCHTGRSGVALSMHQAGSL